MQPNLPCTDNVAFDMERLTRTQAVNRRSALGDLASDSSLGLEPLRTSGISPLPQDGELTPRTGEINIAVTSKWGPFAQAPDSIAACVGHEVAVKEKVEATWSSSFIMEKIMYISSTLFIIMNVHAGDFVVSYLKVCLNGCSVNLVLKSLHCKKTF